MASSATHDLCACRSLAGLSILDMCKLDQLVEAMALDAPGVAVRLHRLLFPTYFPSGEEGPAHVAQLLRQNPTAGQSFCRLLFRNEAVREPLLLVHE